MSGPALVGRYRLYDAIATGGMAAVHLARVVGSAGFQRIVAIKRLHPHLAGDPKFAAMFLDEARVASRVHHPNVVGIIDVVAEAGELFLVMEYVRGESLSALLGAAKDQGAPPSVAVVSALLGGALYGLHAAHEACDEVGRSMEIVHRDVSPQNVLVGVDGIARVVDFGVAKAISRLETTRDGEIKGKLAYMAPEQLERGIVDRRTDVYAASVVLWEALTGARLFAADASGGVVLAVLENEVPPPSRLRPEIDSRLDAIVLCGTARDPAARFSTALEMAEELARVAPPASPRETADWVLRVGAENLTRRAQRVLELERLKLEDVEALPPALSLDSRRQLADAVTDVSDGRKAGRTGTPPDGMRSPSRWMVPVLVALLLMAAVGGVVVSARSKLRATSSGEAATEPSPAPSSLATPSPTPFDLETAPSAADSAALPAPLAEPATPRVPPEGRHSKAPRHAGAVTTTKTRASSADRSPDRPADCDPPFLIDENGIKRFKRWCNISQ